MATKKVKTEDSVRVANAKAYADKLRAEFAPASQIADAELYVSQLEELDAQEAE